MNAPLLQATNVSKRFERKPSWSETIAALAGSRAERNVVRAVDGVSLTIGKGEALGLVGESGCGKSTLGRILCGILPPTDGDVTIDGQSVMRNGAKATRRVQMVFQNPFSSLNPRKCVGDAIAEAPLAHGLITRKDARAYVAEWMSRVGLSPDFAPRYPHQFSGGQRQRVALARALAMQPDIMICDEPVASLDVSIQAQIVNLLMDLRQTLGLTMLFISHDLGVVRHLCDRVAVMYLGRIVELAPAQDLYRKPMHPYTRALFDSIPEIGPDSAEATFRAIAGELPSPLAPPPGCHFHERCPIARDMCRSVRPELAARGTDRMAACHAANALRFEP